MDDPGKRQAEQSNVEAALADMDRGWRAFADRAGPGIVREKPDLPADADLPFGISRHSEQLW
jgi:hypothetical protein